MSICIMHTENPLQGRASGTTDGAGLIAPAASATVVEAGSADIGCSGNPPCDGREVSVTIGLEHPMPSCMHAHGQQTQAGVMYTPIV